MAMAAASQMRQRLAANAVHLTIAPAPTGLAESREILRVLQGFGEVTTYKSLKVSPLIVKQQESHMLSIFAKYHPLKPAHNVALAIFQRPESAQQLLASSPLRFSLETTPAVDYPEEDLQYDGSKTEFPDDIAQSEPSRTDAQELHAPNKLLDSTSRSESQHESPSNYESPEPRTKSQPMIKDFRVQAEVWLGKQQDFIERNPLWGEFKLNTYSAIQQDLARRVPLIGLSDLEFNKAEVPVRILRKRQEELGKKKTLSSMWRENQQTVDGGVAGDGKRVDEGIRKTTSLETIHDG